MDQKINSELLKKDIEILAVDGIDVDWLLKMPKLPTYDEKLTAEFLGKFAGGPVGNFACLASSFGLKVSAACTLGEDEGGEILFTEFLKCGVDTTFIVRKKDFTTPFVIVVVDPTGEKAVIIPRLENNQPVEISDEALARSEYVYMLAADYARSLHVAKRAHALGIKVFLDIEPSESLSLGRLKQILKFCTVASFNEMGFSSRFGQPFSLEKAKSVLDLGPSTLLVTRGKNGVIGMDADRLIEIPGHEVEAKDTTGAGDTFNAAFMSRFLKGESLEKCLRFGNAAAALLIQTMGTRTHIPTNQEILSFLENQSN